MGVGAGGCVCGGGGVGVWGWAGGGVVVGVGGRRPPVGKELLLGCNLFDMNKSAHIYIYIYGSAPFIIVNTNIYSNVVNSDGVSKARRRYEGNMEGTWQEHDGTDGQTDDHEVANRALGPKF